MCAFWRQLISKCVTHPFWVRDIVNPCQEPGSAHNESKVPGGNRGQFKRSGSKNKQTTKQYKIDLTGKRRAYSQIVLQVKFNRCWRSFWRLPKQTWKNWQVFTKYFRFRCFYRSFILIWLITWFWFAFNTYFHLLTLCPGGTSAAAVGPKWQQQEKTKSQHIETHKSPLSDTFSGRHSLPFSWNISQISDGRKWRTVPTDWAVCSAA